MKYSTLFGFLFCLSAIYGRAFDFNQLKPSERTSINALTDAQFEKDHPGMEDQLNEPGNKALRHEWMLDREKILSDQGFLTSDDDADASANAKKVQNDKKIDDNPQIQDNSNLHLKINSEPFKDGDCTLGNYGNDFDGRGTLKPGEYWEDKFSFTFCCKDNSKKMTPYAVIWFDSDQGKQANASLQFSFKNTDGTKYVECYGDGYIRNEKNGGWGPGQELIVKPKPTDNIDGVQFYEESYVARVQYILHEGDQSAYSYHYTVKFGQSCGQDTPKQTEGDTNQDQSDEDKDKKAMDAAKSFAHSMKVMYDNTSPEFKGNILETFRNPEAGVDPGLAGWYKILADDLQAGKSEAEIATDLYNYRKQHPDQFKK